MDAAATTCCQSGTSCQDAVVANRIDSSQTLAADVGKHTGKTLLVEVNVTAGKAIGQPN